MSLSVYYLQLHGMELGTIRHITAGRIFIGYYGYSMRQRRRELKGTRSQAVARIADRTAKNCRGHVS